MILVAGATGMLGSEICRLLAEQKRPFKAMVRSTSDASRVETLQELGASIIEADLKNRPSLDSACKGITTVISTASSTLSRQAGDTIHSVDHMGQINLIDAAREAGVKRFIFLSFRNNPQVQHPLTVAKRKVEEHLMNKGKMIYSIIQAGFFMEVWLSPALGFDYEHGKIRVFGKGNQKISYVSYKDVAKMTVQSLTNILARNKIIEFGGPQAISPNDVVEVFEEIADKIFFTEHIPERELIIQLNNAPDPLAESFAGLTLQVAHGDKINMKKNLKDFPMAMTTVKEYARSAMALAKASAL